MSDKELTYYNIVQEILKRVNDEDGDIYLERAKELVYEGISSLTASENVSQDDIRELLKSETIDILPITPKYKIKIKGEDKVLSDNPSKIISIIDDLSTQEEVVINQISEHRYIELSLAEVNLLNDPDYSPFEDEIFWYRRGTFIYFYPQDRMVSQRLIITYIAEPKAFDYDGLSTELHTKFSLNFLYKVIDYGVGRIREQQSGE